MADLPLVFARPPPPVLRPVGWLLFAGMVLAPMAPLLGALDALEDALPILEDPDALPALTVAGTMIGLIGVPAVCFVGFAVWTRYHYGRCELHETTAVFDIYFHPVATRRLEVPLDELTVRRETPRGLLLEPPDGHSPLRPLLLFATGDELAQVLPRLADR